MAGADTKETDMMTKIEGGSRKSIAAPMRMFIRRISGVPLRSSSQEKSLKTRLSFQSWRRRRSLIPRSDQDSKKVKEDDDSDRENKPFHPQLPRLLPSLVPLPSHKPTPRQSLKRAPLAEPEEVFLSDSKKPKLIPLGNRRLPEKSAKPIKAHHSLRKYRAFELQNSTKMSSLRKSSFVTDMEKATFPQSASDLHSETETEDYSSLNRVHFDLEFEDFAPMSESTDVTTLMQNIDPLSSPMKFDPSKSLECIRKAGMTIFNKDPHMGIDYLTQKGILSNDPTKIAEFLTERGLNRQAVGEYFGKVSDPLAVKVTEEFIKRLNFRHVELDVALRRLLEQVHPDGESQKIEFLLSVLKKCYIEQNLEVYEHFQDVETIGILAYSIMLLHTTFYNQNARRYGKPMTKIEFINNNRGIDNGNDIPTATLEGIYNRVSAKEFRTMADSTDRLRQLDNLFTGPLKPEKLIERHRRYIMLFSALEVLDFSSRKPILPRPASQIRCLFVFNDLLVVTKPIGVNRSNVMEDFLPNGGHRIRSIERLVRVGSPLPPTHLNSESTVPTLVTQRRLSGTNDMRPHHYYSVEVPPNSPFLVRQVIPLIDVNILHFECEYYKFGVQLCDESSVLISLHLPRREVREKFTDVLRNTIWEAKEVQRFFTESKQVISP